ncbi:fimbria/pilus outer membrane usher protein [Pseudomonas asplenii]|uniref:fimbria/pilus outer membrane usher protein n=1 Tax=Pseudomonas asplenii TaxID=53407 RepID=UPI0006CC78C5|nr:fimbria/pilus outer membrane usher protein [Pseudomonas fuscovaginae]KPA97325.1 P pilus assembly protein, porin PapC [Pseudomonas fuscovaginae]
MRAPERRAGEGHGRCLPISRSAQWLIRGLGLVLLGFGEPVSAQKKEEAAEVEFDLSVLSGRGIDPAVADYFRLAPRFREGQQVVNLELNGDSLGLAKLHFDQEGQLCFTTALLDKAGLKPTATTAGRVLDQDCHDFLQAYPQARVSLRPHREEVALLVPTQALRGQRLDEGAYSRGGTAALLNYEVLAVDTRSQQRTERFLSAATEAGFNAGDWVVRSRQLHVAHDGKRQTEHLYAYAQRDLNAWQTTFQAGQISSAGPIFAGVPLSGVQFMPGGSLVGRAGHGVVVRGVAFDSSRVEVRQSGVLIHTTLVPQGPFSLAGLPLLGDSVDLEVRVIGETGGEQRFVVPAASFPGAASVPPGYHLALGRLREGDGDGADEPLLATGSGTWGLGRFGSLSSGLLASDDYRATGWAFDSRVWERVGLGLRSTLSQTTRHSLTGRQDSLSLSSPFVADIDLSLSATLRTAGYRDLFEVHSADRNNDSSLRLRRQYTTALGWSDAQLGGFSLGYSRNLMFDGRSSQRLHGLWSRDYRYASVNLSVDSSVGPREGRHASDPGLGMRLGVSIPLGGDRRIGSYVSRRGDRLNVGGDYRERVSDTLSYDLGLERDLDNRQQLTRANLSLLPRYTQVGLGATRNPSGTRYSGQLSGGVALHGGGLTFSPYAIQETFGVASVGELSGIRLATPQGPVWTDFSGQAVLPGLSAYRESQVEVDSRSLPRRVDLINGVKRLEAGRGSFNRVDFSVVSARRLLLKVTDENAEPLRQGALVSSVEGGLLTTVVGEGMVFLNDAEAGQRLSIRLAEHTHCVLTVELAEAVDNDRPYETATAVCRAI